MLLEGETAGVGRVCQAPEQRLDQERVADLPNRIGQFGLMRWKSGAWQRNDSLKGSIEMVFQHNLSENRPGRHGETVPPLQQLPMPVNSHDGGIICQKEDRGVLLGLAEPDEERDELVLADLSRAGYAPGIPGVLAWGRPVG